MRSIFHLTSKAKQLSYHLFGKNNYKLTQKAVTVIISPYVLLNRVKILCCQDMQKNLDTIRMKMKDGDSTKNHNENSHPVLNSLSPQLCKFVTEMQKKKKKNNSCPFFVVGGGGHGNMVTFHDFFYSHYSLQIQAILSLITTYA